ncbi:cytidylyltransferase domain-containing protein [candidate division KSB1 bacterium]
MNNTTAIIQARMGSTRLPGKICKDLAGKSVLAWVVERLELARKLDQIVIATTDKPEDDPIVELAERLGVAVYRGSDNDVLDRYYQTALKFDADPVVRICSDCPFIDPQIVDGVINTYFREKADFSGIMKAETKNSNNYPRGLSTEVFSFAALEKAWKDTGAPSSTVPGGVREDEKRKKYREHVTLYIYQHPKIFKIRDFRPPPLKSDYSDVHITIDYDEDLVFANKLVQRIGKDGFISIGDILEIIDHEPDLKRINYIPEREGRIKAILE